MPSIKILVACCSTISRSGIYEIFSWQRGFKVVKETAAIKEAILFSKKDPPDIFLFCFNLFMANGNLTFFSEIKKKAPHTKFVLFDSRATFEQELHLVRHGTYGIFNNNSPKRVLVDGIKKIHTGELWFSRKLMFSLATSQLSIEETDSKKRKISLTSRELEVLKKLVSGHTNSQIASQLCLAESTIKTHVNNIYRKIEVKDRLQASFYALKNNLVTR